MAGSILNVFELINALFQIETAVIKAVKSIEEGIQELKDFKFNVDWKNKVIHVPTAIKQMKQFVEDTIGDVLDLVKEVREKIQEFRDQIEQLKKGASAYAGRPVPESVLIGLEFELIIGLIKDVAPMIDAASDFKPLFDGIINKIEHLEPIFLGQQNRRKTEKLLDGGTIRPRIPHSAP